MKMFLNPKDGLLEELVKTAKAGTSVLVSVSKFFDAKTSQIKKTPITHYPPTGRMGA
jgi:hypothetical protein